MTSTLRFKVSILALSAGWLAGCASNSTPAVVAPKGLSLGQVDAVTTAARKMVGDEAAQVHGLKSRRPPSEPGVHVCGYVDTATAKDVPLYVELRETNGALAAERGQVGDRPENLAKVKFMCRNHPK